MQHEKNKYDPIMAEFPPSQISTPQRYRGTCLSYTKHENIVRKHTPPPELPSITLQIFDTNLWCVCVVVHVEEGRLTGVVDARGVPRAYCP